MKTVFRSLMLLGGACVLATPAPSLAQTPAVQAPGSRAIANVMNKTWPVAGRVATLKGVPVPHVKVEVKVVNVIGQFKTVETNFQGEFRTEFTLNADAVKELAMEVTATKPDYRRAHEMIDFGNSGKTREIHITLREAGEDPDLITQADLISTVAPRLKNLGASDGLSAAGEKDYARGVHEFLDRNDPDRALPLFAKVVRRDEACVACQTILGLAQLDSGDWDGAERNFVEAVKAIRADPTRGRSEPLVAYGVMESWRHDPPKAAGLFLEALKFAPQDALALQELGRSQLLLQNWASASEYLAKAISAGAGPEVRLMRMEALLGAGEAEQARQEMTSYLGGRDVKKMPPRVRQLWTRIEEREKVEAYKTVSSDVDEPVEDLLRAIPELQGLEAATGQQQLDAILGAVGKNVAALFRNFPNTVSLEEIHQEKLHRNGKVGGTQDQKFHYLCLAPDQAWGPGFNEYRADQSGNIGTPRGLEEGFMLTSGFVSATLVFHPAHQPEATFRLLGSQRINGRDTFVIAFAQRPARARWNGTFKYGQTKVPTFSQGLAWVDAENYQITRLRTDLLKPLPEVRLEKETTEIDFGEAHFKDIAQGFWLPHEVTVSVDWNGRHLRNRHQYSEFKVFNVESKDKIGTPKASGENSNAARDPKAPL
ncbi:MAG: hypothetical protein ABSB82_13440 [Terriglobia bacterium]